MQITRESRMTRRSSVVPIWSVEVSRRLHCSCLSLSHKKTQSRKWPLLSVAVDRFIPHSRLVDSKLKEALIQLDKLNRLKLLHIAFPLQLQITRNILE